VSSDWRTDLAKSSSAFQRQVWPILQPHVGGGELHNIEALKDIVGDKLDQSAGFDWLQTLPNGAIRAVASRVQWGRSWDTFTIRLARSSGAKTEWEKRKFAIRRTEQGFCFPGLTTQGYVSGDDVTAAAVWTTHLVSAVEQAQIRPGLWPTSERKSNGVWTNQTTNASFIVVSWEALRAAGMKVVVAKGTVAPEEAPA
jgi:hypothetical protein